MPNPDLPIIGVTLLQLLLVATVGGLAAIMGGVTGYGTGLILPLILVPTIGAEATVPVIGAMLMLLVPAKRRLKRSGLRLRSTSLGFASAGFGLLVGGTAGSGIVLLSILMAAGLGGRAVVATDVTITFLLGLAKTGVFQSTGLMTPAAWAMALVIGLIAVPGAFIAKWLTERMPVRIHDLIIEAMVFLGGGLLVWRGLSELWLRT